MSRDAQRQAAWLADWRDRSLLSSRLAGIGVFLAVEGLVSLAPGLARPNAANLAYTGGIALALAVLQRVRGVTHPLPGVMAGVVLVGLAYALPLLAGAGVLQGLVAALAVALAFAAVGAVGLSLE